MRNFVAFFVMFASFYIVLVFSGCEKGTSTGMGGPVMGPAVTLNSGTNFVSFNQELGLDVQSFTVSITGTRGDAALNNLLIEENGTLIQPDRLLYQGTQFNGQLSGAQTEGFTLVIEIFGNNGMVGQSTYGFILTDVDGESSRASVNIFFTAVTPPIALVSGNDRVHQDATVNTFSGLFNVRVEIVSSVVSLLSLAIFEDGSLLQDDQLKINDGFIEAVNPFSLTANGSFYDIQINPDRPNNDTRNYTFRVTDTNGLTSEINIIVTFDAPVVRPISFNTSAVLYNSARSGEYGGLDLDTGESVGSFSRSAEIQDEGINLNSSSAETWRAQISAVTSNNSTTNVGFIRVAKLNVVGSGMTFDSISSVDEIELLFAEGALADGDDNFSSTVGDLEGMNEVVTRPLQGSMPGGAEEVIVVKHTDRYYLVRIDEVRYLANSDNDNYLMSIKR